MALSFIVGLILFIAFLVGGVYVLSRGNTKNARDAAFLIVGIILLILAVIVALNLAGIGY